MTKRFAYCQEHLNFQTKNVWGNQAKQKIWAANLNWINHVNFLAFENDMKPLAKLKKHKNVALLHASHFCLPLLQ